jgi:hypothetical protein
MSENQAVLNYREQYAKAWTLPKPSKVNALKSLEELCQYLPVEGYAEANYRSLLRYFQASPSKSTPKTLPEWASLFRSKDQVRRNITELHISGGKLESTCGSIAIQIPGYSRLADGYYSHELLRIEKDDNYPNFEPILQGGNTLPEIMFHGLESCEVGTLDDSGAGAKHSGLVFRLGNKWIQKKYMDTLLAGRKLASLDFRGDDTPTGPLHFFGWCSNESGSLSELRGVVMPIRHEA